MRIFPKLLKKHWADPKGLIQVFLGPRQVGKTTTALSLMDKTSTVYASADLPSPPTIDFIVNKWQEARALKSVSKTLILDEIQKIPRWSEAVKGLWDEDIREKSKLRVCLLGSSALMIEKGLSESLTGRFETNFFPHWTFRECAQIFGATLHDYLCFGGYPKAYDFRDDPDRGENYIQNSIVEPTLGRDILSMHAVDKPALLRQIFWYVSQLPAHIVSFEKILGHLQGKGNAATIVHYADLLETAFVTTQIFKFSARSHRTKRSLPKWIIPNPALVHPTIRKANEDGFVFENLVGSHLLNIFYGDNSVKLHYWAEDGAEIDFILCQYSKPVLALEVKSGRVKNTDRAKKIFLKQNNCQFGIVHNENINAFLNASTINEILSVF